jgi:hypothetical protein
MQRVLIHGVALPAAAAQIGGRLKEQSGPRHFGELAPQSGGNEVGGDFAIGERFQGDEDKAGVRLPAAGEADHAFDGRIGLHDRLQLGELQLHRLE